MLGRARLANSLGYELTKAEAANRALDRWLDRLGDEVAKPRNDDGHGRRLGNLMAYALQASELAKHAETSVFETFCRSRLDADWGYVYGTLESTPELAGIVQRATVVRF